MQRLMAFCVTLFLAFAANAQEFSWLERENGERIGCKIIKDGVSEESRDMHKCVQTLSYLYRASDQGASEETTVSRVEYVSRAPTYVYRSREYEPVAYSSSYRPYMAEYHMSAVERASFHDRLALQRQAERDVATQNMRFERCQRYNDPYSPACQR